MAKAAHPINPVAQPQRMRSERAHRRTPKPTAREQSTGAGGCAVLSYSLLTVPSRSFVTQMLAPRRRPRLQGLGAVASGNPEIPESTLGQKVFSFLVTHPRPPSFDGSNTKRFPDFYIRC